MGKATEALELLAEVRNFADKVGGLDVLGSLVDALSGKPALGAVVQQAVQESNSASRARRAAKAVRKRPGTRKPRAAKVVAEKVAAEPKADPSSGKRKRASGEEVQARKDAVVAVFDKLPVPFAKKDVAQLVANVESRTLALLVKDGKLTQKGEKKNARYWVKAA